MGCLMRTPVLASTVTNKWPIRQWGSEVVVVLHQLAGALLLLLRIVSGSTMPISCMRLLY